MLKYKGRWFIETLLFLPVIGNLGEEGSNPILSPISPNDGQNVAEHIGFGDGAIDIADDDLVRVLPLVNMTFASWSALISRGHAKRGFIRTWTKVQLQLKNMKIDF